jgi:CheY-like chemotaxis protein
LRIEVWDTGIGIPEDQRQNIFNEFYQVADARANGGGLGLGLAIVDRLCRLLEHSLEVTSTYGKGSCFSITLARAPARVALAEVPDRLQPIVHRFADKLVVMIEVDKRVLESMEGLLRGWGCRVSTWTAGEAALANFIEPYETPDIIISDYHLSHGKTGIEAIERIRAAFHASIPALLITGDTSVERKAEAMAAGCKLLQKPVPPMTLRAMLYAVFQQSDSVEAHVGATPANSF